MKFVNIASACGAIIACSHARYYDDYAEIIMRDARKCRECTKSGGASIRGRDVMRFLIPTARPTALACCRCPDAVIIIVDIPLGARAPPENTIRTTVYITFGIIHVALRRQIEFI